MAEAVVSSAVERLKDLSISEAIFLYGVKDKVQEIQGELERLQKFLKDADNKRGSPEVGRWIAEIREVALQMEDVLETYAVKVASSREEEITRRFGCIVGECMWRFACIIGECIALHKIGSEIGTIQAKITNLATSRQELGIQALRDQLVESSKAEEAERRQLRITVGHLPVNDFVGMKDEIKDLVSYLKNKDRGYEVVSVWGMGGQGKTTLARKVYRLLKDEDNKDRRFEAFAWVCITQKLERQKVLQDILRRLLPTKSDDEITKMGVSALVEELFEIQKKLKCLVVIDDIWSVTHWELLKDAFPIDDERSGSKILLTTRNEAVAKIGVPYKLRSLTAEEGWELFLKKTFPRGAAAVEPEKEDLGRNMVRQCQGLPLAISVLGGILGKKNSVKEWKMVKQDIGSHLRRGEGFEDDKVKHILDLSYDDLSFRLKQLFLYLGTFKEDEEIKCDELYLQWIAERMIPIAEKAKGEMFIDVAERYLVELAQRSLIQLEPMDKQLSNYSLVPGLKFRSCRLHDLIRELCLLKGQEEDFLKMIDFRIAHNDDVVSGVEARRLASYMYNDADNNALVKLMEQQHMNGQLRSLLFVNACLSPKKINNLNLENFKLVRVLKLHGFDFTKKELSQGIIELIHLRYLSLKDCELEELPSCIGNLRYLETLDLRVDSFVIIPDVLWKMKHLKHLYLPQDINRNKKLRFDGLKELELLWHFNTSDCDANDLMKLTNLQVLDIRTYTLQELNGVMNFVSSDLHHLRYTSLLTDHQDNDLIQLLQCENIDKLSIYRNTTCNYMMIPRPYEQPRPSQNLTCIHLRYCNIEAEAMVLLEKLPNLQNLEVLHSSFAANEFVCTASSFPGLIRLHLRRIKNLERWSVDKGALPNLSKLDIRDCKKLKMLPKGLQFLTSLRELVIWGMPKTFNDRVRVMNGVKGQDFHKVRHIPNIFIGDEED